jgi:hypothetical protein
VEFEQDAPDQTQLAFPRSRTAISGHIAFGPNNFRSPNIRAIFGATPVRVAAQKGLLVLALSRGCSQLMMSYFTRATFQA